MNLIPFDTLKCFDARINQIAVVIHKKKSAIGRGKNLEMHDSQLLVNNVH